MKWHAVRALQDNPPSAHFLYNDRGTPPWRGCLRGDHQLRPCVGQSDLRNPTNVSDLDLRSDPSYHCSVVARMSRLDQQRENAGESVSTALLHIVDGKPATGFESGSLAQALRFLQTPFASAWHHRDLVTVILRRELRERFKGSVAGWVWAVLSPLLSLLTYTVAFSGLATLPDGTVAVSPIDYAMFIFGGLIAFNFFSEMAYRAPSLLHEYAHFIKHTMFPAALLPVISTLRAMVYTTIGLILMLACQLVFMHSLHWTVILLPLWYVAFLAFLMGLTWFLSALGAFARDTSHLMMTITPLLMFATPVFYSPETLSPTMQLVMYGNILTGFVEIVRDLVVFGRLPGAIVTLWTLFLSAVTFWFGYWFFCRRQDGIVDVI
jgi:lipopolysaccharide transport system permease protein